MATMGRYCKAYLLARFREFPGWAENAACAQVEPRTIDGREVEAPRELGPESILYLQDTYVVTDGIFQDENVIFDAVTEEWKAFCQAKLEFSIPDYIAREAQAETAAQADASGT